MDDFARQLKSTLNGRRHAMSDDSGAESEDDLPLQASGFPSPPAPPLAVATPAPPPPCTPPPLSKVAPPPLVAAPRSAAADRSSRGGGAASQPLPSTPQTPPAASASTAAPPSTPSPHASAPRSEERSPPSTGGRPMSAVAAAIARFNTPEVATSRPRGGPAPRIGARAKPTTPKETRGELGGEEGGAAPRAPRPALGSEDVCPAASRAEATPPPPPPPPVPVPVHPSHSSSPPFAAETTKTERSTAPPPSDVVVAKLPGTGAPPSKPSQPEKSGAEEAGEEASDAAVKDSFRANLASILMGSGPARPAPQPAPQDLEEEEEACEADDSRRAFEAESPAPAEQRDMASPPPTINPAAHDIQPLDYPSPLKALLGENHTLWLNGAVVDLDVDVPRLQLIRRGGEAKLHMLSPEDGVASTLALHHIKATPAGDPDPAQVAEALLQSRLYAQLMMRSELPRSHQYSRTSPPEEEQRVRFADSAANRLGVQARALLLKLSPVVSLRHPNLVRVHGLCSTKQGLGMMLDMYPYTLVDVLSALRDAHSKLNPSDRLRCAYQVASGVEALHRSGTCHLRLAAHNVWVAVDGKEMRCAVVNAAMLGWLGLSSAQCLMGAHLEFPGMPDLVEVTLDRQRGPLGKAADVFDMGMLMWQLASGRAVREGFNVEDMRESTAEEMIRMRPAVPSGLEPEFVELMQQCWSTDKERRPGMAAVVARLKAVLRRLRMQNPNKGQEPETPLPAKTARILRNETEVMLQGMEWARMPPPFAESDRCFACKVEFSLFSTWKFHCRHCGHSFCQAHVPHEVNLPHLGLDKKQRVCEECFPTLPARNCHLVALESSRKQSPVLKEQSKCTQCKEQIVTDGKTGLRRQCQWCGNCFCEPHCKNTVQLPEYGNPKGVAELGPPRGCVKAVCAPCLSSIREARGGLSDVVRANLLMHLGYYSAASELFIAAIETCKRAEGRRHPSYMHTMLSLARCCVQDGRHDAARGHFKKLLAVQKHVLGEYHVDIALTTKEYAECELQLGNKAHAEKLQKASVHILEQVHGETDVAVAEGLDARAKLLMKRDKLEEAEACYVRALNIKAAHYGENHMEVARSAQQLANCLDAQGDFHRSLALYARAASATVAAAGASSPPAGAARKALCNAHITVGQLEQKDRRHDQAKIHYQSALTLAEEVNGPVDGNVALVLDNLGDLARRGKAFLEAAEAYNRALSIRVAVLGEQHPAVGETLRNLGIVAQCEGRYKDAEEMYTHAITICSMGGSEMDASVTELRQTLSALRYAMGKQ